MSLSRALLIGGVLLGLAGCAASPPIERESAPVQGTSAGQHIAVAGTYRHPGSGMAFPASLGPLTRKSLVDLDGNRGRVGALYILDDPHSPMEVRVVVYRDPMADVPGADPAVSRERAWQALRKTVNSELDNPLILDSHSAAAPEGTGPAWGRYLLVMYNDRQRQALLLEDALYLFEANGWYVQYRFTFPAPVDPRPQIAFVMRRLGLPPGPSAKAGQ